MGWFGISSRRAAYIALACLTLLWGMNWAAMKAGLQHADPIIFNIERTWVAIATLFAVLLLQRRRLWPESWLAVCVTGFFQTTINFGATAMALASGGAGRTAVLVFTMPFWTLLIAWPVLGERVRGSQWFAVGFALLGLVLVVEPWNWQGDLAAKLWAAVSGLGWAGGTVAQAYFQRQRRLEGLTLITWQMAVGILPITALPFFLPLPAADWNVAYLGSILYAGVIGSGIGFVLWVGVLGWLPAGSAALNMLAIPVIALLSSMLIFGERLTALEWLGIASIGVGLVIVSARAWSARR
ncbi:MAG: DMT family transporter [Alphaproteobacteria bacterium]|nr:DMT family transporter [Alphaproteobacteria bacterium]